MSLTLGQVVKQPQQSAAWMRTWRLPLIALCNLAILSGCASQQEPVIKPVTMPALGAWTYVVEKSETFAIFETSPDNPIAILRCDTKTGIIGLGRYAEATYIADAAITTGSLVTSGQASIRESIVPVSAIDLDDTDPLLDALTEEGQTFLFEIKGLPPLVLPTSNILANVINDCG